MRFSSLLLAAPLLSLLIGCNAKPHATADPVVRNDAPTLALYELADQDPAVVKLPKEIHEISGLAMTADGRLFGIGDEKAAIYQLDDRSGDIIKRFQLGDPVIKGDFEGLAVKEDTLFAITSGGEIYSFLEGEDGSDVPYAMVTTGLSRYDIEGLCFDSATDALLIACKEMPDREYKGNRAIFSWSLASRSLAPTPRFLLSEDSIKELSGSSLFRPSSIERHPTTGSFLVLASQGSAVIELAGDGRILGRVELPRAVHGQPEGLTVAPDGRLIISDEGATRGTLVAYPPLR
jgi:uncharacterized protein YjiK